MAIYLRPDRLDDALEALDGNRLTIIAGGTDFYPARVGTPLDEDVLDVSRLTGLRGIEERDDGFHIGALTTWSDVLRADLPPWFDGLKQCARELGAMQTQNSATVAGNLCNASPAADGMPCLLTLDARVELAAAGGTRTLAVADFVTGRGETARRDGEMVTGLSIPQPANPASGAFFKLGARRYMIISIVSVAAVLEAAADGTVAAARIAVGACSPVAQRLGGLERELAGRDLSPALADAVETGHLSALTPITDFRGSGAYRLDAALTVVRRVLADLGARMGEG